MHSEKYVTRPTGLDWIPQALWPDHDDKKLGLMSDIVSAHDIERVLAFVPTENRRTCIQAGGAMGIWPKKLARYFHTVYTFEPHPQNFYCTVVNCPEENVIKMQAALGDMTGVTVRVDFPEHPENHGGFRIVGEGDVPMLTVDSLELCNVDLLYLDLEGAEFMAIRGAQDTIEKWQPYIVIEDKHGCCVQFGYNVGDIGRFLATTYGYRELGRLHGDRDIVYGPSFAI